MPTTLYGDVSPRTAAWAAKKLLERGQNLMVTERFGTFDPQPKRKSDTRKWRRYHSLANATAPLSDGVTPAGQKLTYTDYTATLEYYGDLVEITDKIADMHEDPVLDQAMTLCSEQLAETIELLRIAVLRAGTNVSYANGVASRALVTSPATKSDLRKIIRSFKRNKAKEISSIISATAKVSTTPVAPAYFCMGHTDCDADIRNISGFVSIEQYSDSSKALPGEIGKVDSIRFILTNLFLPWEQVGLTGTTYLSGRVKVTSTAQCDVYPLIIVAQNAYGIVPLQGADAVTPVVFNPKPTPSDPMGRKGSVSWKSAHAAVILNHQWIARLEVAATADPV